MSYLNTIIIEEWVDSDKETPIAGSDAMEYYLKLEFQC